MPCQRRAPLPRDRRRRSCYKLGRNKGGLRIGRLVTSASSPLWVLLGRRAGDNRQMLALAEATGLPFAVKPLRFNAASALPNWLLRGSRLSLTPAARAELVPPWPRVVIASGRRAVAAARWIRARSGGATRLVQIGRPWAPLSWFDLVITTPQYGLPKRPSVIHNLMPLGAAEAGPAPAASLLQQLAALPAPRIGVLIGGDSRPFVLDGESAGRLAARANALAAQCGGSLLLVTGPRSSAEATAALRRAASVPARFFAWGDGEPGYAATLRLADRFLVTGDSASMLAEAAATGRPVEVFPLPERPDLRVRLARRLRRLLPRSAFERLVGAGLVTSVRDIAGYAEALRAKGLFDGGPQAAARRAAELAGAAERVRRLAEIAEGVEAR